MGILSLGIIDYLRLYTWDKQLESKVRWPSHGSEMQWSMGRARNRRTARADNIEDLRVRMLCIVCAWVNGVHVHCIHFRVARSMSMVCVCGRELAL